MYAYLLEIHNCRGSVYFSIRKIVAADDLRLKEWRYYQPFADEFSREEINYFRTYFNGYLEGLEIDPQTVSRTLPAESKL